MKVLLVTKRNDFAIIVIIGNIVIIYLDVA